jgi:excinuclease UvrABC nuclease subunit
VLGIIKAMKKAAESLDFEKAAQYRDELKILEQEELQGRV